MVCRIGMSTNPHCRIRYWKVQEGYTRPKILATGLTSQAQARGCRHSGGGRLVPRKRPVSLLCLGPTQAINAFSG